MLYLNSNNSFISLAYLNLTLTSVVFEYGWNANDRALIKFNFNKCCIWIIGAGLNIPSEVYLTLTSVVFEFFLLFRGWLAPW